jgi:hypothetical protein
MINMVISYIDPGSGALLLQLIIAGFVGVGVYFRDAIRALFGSGKKKPDESKDS